MLLHALITLAAAEEAEPSKTPYYVAGGLLVAFALIVSALGIRREDFPSRQSQARVVMGLAVLLVAATMASAVLTG